MALSRIPPLCVLALALFSTTITRAQDADGDGLSDRLERILATDPNFAEKLDAVAESPQYAPTGDRPARYDLTRVRFGNVAKGRWLWAIGFAKAYSFDNASLILYVDSDNDPATGRPGMGCEVTYGHSQGRSTQMFYLADDKRPDFAPARVGLEDGVLYLCADLPLNQEDGRSTFRMTILSEQVKPHESRDSLGWKNIDGPGDSDREKVKTLADLTENEGFEVTQSMELLWKVQADKRNVILNSFRDCEYEGYVYNHSEYRWPSLRKGAGEATITATAPKAGGFFPGIVVYDSTAPEGYEMTIDGEVIGRFVARADNNRQRLFFASEARSFRGGEKIVLRAGNTGAPHLVEDIVLLAERPPVIEPTYEIRNFEVAWDWLEGCVRATWITTWPAKCTLRWDGGEVVEEEATQNHRVYLPDLDPEKRKALFVEAPGRAGETVRSGELRAMRGATPSGVPVTRDSIALSVVGGEAVELAGHFTAGIPFPQGVLHDTRNLRLIDAEEEELPLQARRLLNWPDGTVKVALIDAFLPRQEPPQAKYRLEYGRGVARLEPADSAFLGGAISTAEDDHGITVTTPTLRVHFSKEASGLFTGVEVDDDGELVPVTRDDAPATMSIVDEAGNAYDTLGPPDSIILDEAGPLRTVVRADGHHTGPSGKFFTYQARFTFFAEGEAIKVSYRWGNEVSAAEFTKFRRIRFELPLVLGDNATFAIGADDPVTGKLAEGCRLEQLRDDAYTVGERKGQRAPGWVLAGDSRRGGALVCRDFWQLYPKALEASGKSLSVDLCPAFGDDEYNDCSELDLIKLYYYLQDGRYKVRQGVTKTHDVWLTFWTGGRDGATEAIANFARWANEPPLLAADPEWYAQSGVFGSFVPQTAGRTPRYDEVTTATYESYTRGRDSRHEFGMLNFGDQWGERKVNYDNGEYDHHHTAAQMFVRSGDPRWFYLMEEMARHDIDVDLCHYHANPRYRGGSWIHSMGHTGGYFSKPYEGKWGIPGGGMSVSHTWCEGTCEYYLLTGDPTAIEAARMIADHYDGTYLNNYDFTNGRIPGWHLLLTMAVYRATYDPYYLNAARLIVDRVLERRTPDSGWARQLVPGHCHCQPRCRGACSFMQGILGCGLREYYLETRDERIRQAIIDSARYVIDEMWVEEQTAFRYTSCPKSGVTAGRNDTLAGLLLFAHELSGDPKFADIAERGMDAGFEHLRSVQHLRWTPYLVYALDKLGSDVLRRPNGDRE